LRTKGFPERFWNIALFYTMAILCLVFANLYAFSWKLFAFDDDQGIRSIPCAYFMVETLCPIFYLLSAYAYLKQSLSTMFLKEKMQEDSKERIKLVR